MAFYTFYENLESNHMKATGQKLKKLKTRQVYGFKKDQFIIGAMADPTLTTTTVSSHVILNALNYN